jgi:hypothetical protein
VVEADEEVIVTYELRRPDGSGGRNTEVLTFDHDDKIVRTERRRARSSSRCCCR